MVGWEEKRRLKLTSTKVEVEVEAELGNSPVQVSHSKVKVLDFQTFLFLIPCSD